MKKILTLCFVLTFGFTALQAQSNALHFDGVDDNVTVPDNDLLDLAAADDLTLQFWFSTTFDGFKPIFNKYDPANGYQGYGTAIYQNGILGFAKISPEGHAQVNSTLGYNDGEWHQVTAILSGTDPANYEVYIDGNMVSVTVTSNTFGSGEMINASDLKIGTDGGTYYEGAIDELRIWSKALTSEDIAANWNTSLTGTETDLVAYYNFDEGTADGDNADVTTLTDMGDNSLDGTLNNFALTGTTSNWVGGVELNESPTSFNETSLPSLGAFPNPAGSSVVINGLNEQTTYSFYNMVGEVVKTGVIAANAVLNIQDLSSGVYILQFPEHSPVRLVKE